MSLDNPTDEEQAYLNKVGRHGCSRIISAILLGFILVFVGLNVIPEPINIYIIVGLALITLVRIVIWLTDRLIGPFPAIPESLRKEIEKHDT